MLISFSFWAFLAVIKLTTIEMTTLMKTGPFNRHEGVFSGPDSISNQTEPYPLVNGPPIRSPFSQWNVKPLGSLRLCWRSGVTRRSEIDEILHKSAAIVKNQNWKKCQTYLNRSWWSKQSQINMESVLWSSLYLWGANIVTLFKEGETSFKMKYVDVLSSCNCQAIGIFASCWRSRVSRGDLK